jgi:hypothetical protein
MIDVRANERADDKVACIFIQKQISNIKVHCDYFK